LRAAAGQVDRFSHGVHFVDLAPVGSADLLAATILRTLPHPPSGLADAQDQLLGFLADKHLLLVLDNFEHLLEGAGLVPELLAAAPRLKVLVTSRVRLNLREEWLAPLEGLEVPGDLDNEATNEHEEREARSPRRDASEPSRSSRSPAPRAVGEVVDFASLRDFVVQPAALERYSATALFLACVRRLRPGFEPGDDDAGHIVRICRLLGGMPLAIELAAARTRSLPVGEIARELAHGLGLWRRRCGMCRRAIAAWWRLSTTPGACSRRGNRASCVSCPSSVAAVRPRQRKLSPGLRWRT